MSKPYLFHWFISVNSTDIYILFLLAVSVYYKYSIFKMNIFMNLFLVIMILLTRLTCFRKFYVLYISRRSSFFLSNLNTSIVFQSFRTILLLNIWEVSFFTKGLCVFAILGMIALNFPKSKFYRKLQNIFKKLEMFFAFSYSFSLYL